MKKKEDLYEEMVYTTRSSGSSSGSSGGSSSGSSGGSSSGSSGGSSSGSGSGSGSGSSSNGSSLSLGNITLDCEASQTSSMGFINYDAKCPNAENMKVELNGYSSGNVVASDYASGGHIRGMFNDVAAGKYNLKAYAQRGSSSRSIQSSITVEDTSHITASFTSSQALAPIDGDGAIMYLNSVVKFNVFASESSSTTAIIYCDNIEIVRAHSASNTTSGTVVFNTAGNYKMTGHAWINGSLQTRNFDFAVVDKSLVNACGTTNPIYFTGEDLSNASSHITKGSYSVTASADSPRLILCNCPEAIQWDEKEGPDAWILNSTSISFSEVGTKRFVIYGWHDNKSNIAFNYKIDVKKASGNGNVTVSYNLHGTDAQAKTTDRVACVEYLGSVYNEGHSGASVALNANNSQNIFCSEVPGNASGGGENLAFGVIGNIDIVNNSTENAEIVLYEYITKINNNSECSSSTPVAGTNGDSTVRGVGYSELTVQTEELQVEEGKVARFTYACTKKDIDEYMEKENENENNDKIIDDWERYLLVDETYQSGSQYNTGLFGVTIRVNLTFRNKTGKTGDFYIVVGSDGGSCYPVVRSVNNESTQSSNFVTSAALDKFYDRRTCVQIMKVSNVHEDAVATVSFYIINAAGSNGVYSVAVMPTDMNWPTENN